MREALPELASIMPLLVGPRSVGVGGWLVLLGKRSVPNRFYQFEKKNVNLIRRTFPCAHEAPTVGGATRR